MSDLHSEEQVHSGVMEDKVPIKMLTFLLVGVAVIVVFASLGLRKGFIRLTDDTVYEQQLKEPDSRLTAMKAKSEPLLRGEAVGEITPKRSIDDAMKLVAGTPGLLKPLREAPPTEDTNNTGDGPEGATP